MEDLSSLTNAERRKICTKIVEGFAFEDWKNLHSAMILDCDTIIELLKDYHLPEDETLLKNNWNSHLTNKSNAMYIKKEILREWNGYHFAYVNIPNVYTWLGMLISQDIFGVGDDEFAFHNTKLLLDTICRKKK